MNPSRKRQFVTPHASQHRRPSWFLAVFIHVAVLTVFTWGEQMINYESCTVSKWLVVVVRIAVTIIPCIMTMYLLYILIFSQRGFYLLLLFLIILLSMHIFLKSCTFSHSFLNKPLPRLDIGAFRLHLIVMSSSRFLVATCFGNHQADYCTN